MTFDYWFALFATAAFANMLGLNISASFNSAVTIYILIPLLMIPMMILSGAMFPFDKMNRRIGSIKKVPLIAEIMPTKWSFEALMVNQFKNNKFEKTFYEIEKRESNADFKQVHYIPKLEDRIYYIEDNWYKFDTDPAVKKIITEYLQLLNTELHKEEQRTGIPLESGQKLDPALFNEEVLYSSIDFIKELKSYYSLIFRKANTERNNIISYLEDINKKHYESRRAAFHSESVEEQVKKAFEKNAIIQYKDELVQQIDPIYRDPDIEGYFNFRSHFFAPRKYFAGKFHDTYWFNMIFIWFLTAFLYITLYFNVLNKILDLPEKIKIKNIFSKS